MSNPSTEDRIKALDFKVAGLTQNLETIAIAFDLLAKSTFPGEKCEAVARSLNWLNQMAVGLMKEKESLEDVLKQLRPTPPETPEEPRQTDPNGPEAKKPEMEVVPA